jgi:hypothetical protein
MAQPRRRTTGGGGAARRARAAAPPPPAPRRAAAAPILREGGARAACLCCLLHLHYLSAPRRAFASPTSTMAQKPDELQEGIPDTGPEPEPDTGGASGPPPGPTGAAAPKQGLKPGARAPPSKVPPLPPTGQTSSLAGMERHPSKKGHFTPVTNPGENTPRLVEDPTGQVKCLICPDEKQKLETKARKADREVQARRQMEQQKDAAERALAAAHTMMFHRLGTGLPWSANGGAKDETVWDKKRIFKVRSPGEGRSAPVYFIQFETKEIVVIKCVHKGESSRIFVGDRLVNHFGIRTPNIRFVVRSSEELQKITENLKQTVDRNSDPHNATDKDDMAAHCLEKLTTGFEQYEAVMVMQYINGVSIDEWLRNHDGSSDYVAKLMRRVGRLVLCDMLIDNSDRFMFPGVWGIGESNTGNALVTHTGELIAIDHDLKLLTTRAACDEHNRKVARVLNAYASTGFEKQIDLGKGDPIKHLVESLSTNDGNPFFEGCEAHVRLGMLHGLVIAANCPQM